MTCHLCLPALCFCGTPCDKQHVCTPWCICLNRRVCVCVCMASGLSDEISISTATWSGPLTLHRCVFRSQRHFQCRKCAGCFCAVFLLRPILCSLRDHPFTVPWREHGNKRISYTRLRKLPYTFPAVCTEVLPLFFHLLRYLSDHFEK